MKSKIKLDNTEPSLVRNNFEGVTTEIQAYGNSFNKKYYGNNGSLIIGDDSKRARGHELNHVRYSLNPMVTWGTEMNNTQSQIIQLFFRNSCKSIILVTFYKGFHMSKRSETIKNLWANGTFKGIKGQKMSRTCFNCKYNSECSRDKNNVCNKHIIYKKRKVKTCSLCYKYEQCKEIYSLEEMIICELYKYKVKVDACRKAYLRKSPENKAISLKAMQDNKLKHHSKETKAVLAKIAKSQYQKALKDGSELERRKKISKFQETFNISSEGKSIRLDAGKKISATIQSNPDKYEKRLKKILSARKINNAEKNVENLKIKGLDYSGCGKVITRLKKENGKIWFKNPDFVYYKNDTIVAVVEVMDFNYHHKRSEIEPLIKAYKEQDIICVVIDARYCYNLIGLRKIKTRIKNLIAARQDNISVSH